MPDSIDALDKLGVAIPAAAGYRLDGISFFDAQSSVSAPFPQGHGIGLRRTVLHNLLLKRAQELGVVFPVGRIRMPPGTHPNPAIRWSLPQMVRIPPPGARPVSAK